MSESDRRQVEDRQPPATGRRDPGDAVPPGVAPEQPASLDEEARRAKESLERKLRGA
jgi:hypothetical protein